MMLHRIPYSSNFMHRDGDHLMDVNMQVKVKKEVSAGNLLTNQENKLIKFFQ